MKIIMFGAPGAGKGTHSKKIMKEYHIPQISTGDIFRKLISEGTPLGLQLRDTIARGEFVSDDITVGIVIDRLKEADCANGYVLDGFPRSTAQAKAFDSLVDIDKVIYLDVDEEHILDRIIGRRFCHDCGGIYNVTTLQGEVCPKCGSDLHCREDDTEEVVIHRLHIYRDTTAPLIDYYRAKGKLLTVDGNAPVDVVYSRLSAMLPK